MRERIAMMKVGEVDIVKPVVLRRVVVVVIAAAVGATVAVFAATEVDVMMHGELPLYSVQ